MCSDKMKLLKRERERRGRKRMSERVRKRVKERKREGGIEEEI